MKNILLIVIEIITISSAIVEFETTGFPGILMCAIVPIVLFKLFNES